MWTSWYVCAQKTFYNTVVYIHTLSMWKSVCFIKVSLSSTNEVAVLMPLGWGFSKSGLILASFRPFWFCRNHIIFTVAFKRTNSGLSVIDRNQNHWNKKCSQKNSTSHVKWINIASSLVHYQAWEKKTDNDYVRFLLKAQNIFFVSFCYFSLGLQ